MKDKIAKLNKYLEKQRELLQDTIKSPAMRDFYRREIRKTESQIKKLKEIV